MRRGWRGRSAALPWDVDLLLVSGGMKGVTVGSNISFPNAAMGYSQVNYSLSLVGGVAKGITEAKGKPVISGEAYRYSPRLRYKRSMPRQFYESLQARYAPDEQPMQPAAAARPTPSGRLQPATPAYATGRQQGIPVSQELYNMAGFDPGQRIDHLSVTQTQMAP